MGNLLAYIYDSDREKKTGTAMFARLKERSSRLTFYGWYPINARCLPACPRAFGFNGVVVASTISIGTENHDRLAENF
jgi:hypothetical protein